MVYLILKTRNGFTYKIKIFYRIVCLQGVEQLIVTGDLSSGCHSDHGQSTHNALVSAQRAVHLYPGRVQYISHG